MNATVNCTAKKGEDIFYFISTTFRGHIRTVCLQCVFTDYKLSFSFKNNKKKICMYLDFHKHQLKDWTL